MPTINPHQLSATFNTALFTFLKTRGVEGYYNFLYLDSRGIPTLGAGYAS